MTETSVAAPAPDFTVHCHGSIYLFVPENEPAREHLLESVQDDATWFGGALVVEHSYARPLAEALIAYGWRVS